VQPISHEFNMHQLMPREVGREDARQPIPMNSITCYWADGMAGKHDQFTALGIHDKLSEGQAEDLRDDQAVLERLAPALHPKEFEADLTLTAG
jgi:hypothetical protein